MEIITTSNHYDPAAQHLRKEREIVSRSLRYHGRRARPPTYEVRGPNSVKLRLVVRHHAGHRELPIVELQKVA